MKRTKADQAPGCALEALEGRVLFAFGDSDLTFGVKGRAVTTPFIEGQHVIQQLLITSGQKILAGGGDAGLARFTSAGVLDKTFGTNGVQPISPSFAFLGDAVDPTNNNIYVLVTIAQVNQLLRYTANGKVDSTYGTNGAVTLTNPMVPQALAVQSDGKVIVAGKYTTNSLYTGEATRVIRLQSNGKVDTGFGSNGVAEFNLGVIPDYPKKLSEQVTGVKILSGGKIDIVGGAMVQTSVFVDPNTGDIFSGQYFKDTFAVARLTTGGALDSAYGSGGIARDDYATGEEMDRYYGNETQPTAFAARPDGSILVAGIGNGTTVAEFDPSGKVKYTTGAGPSWAGVPFGLAVLKDGRAVIVADPEPAFSDLQVFPGRGLQMAELKADGTLGNFVFTNNNDSTTPDLSNPDWDPVGISSAVAAVTADGNLLVGGGDGQASFLIKKILVGSANDPRPDNFTNARANDIVKDSKGGLHLAYYDAATTHLVYDHRNPNGVWDAPVVIDNGADAGQYVSIAVNSAGLAGIAYFDGSTGDLKLAEFTGSAWKLETVDSKGSVGLYPSFQFDHADEPVVTYYNKTKGKLTFALKSKNKTWAYENVDSSKDNVGRSNVLVASPTTGRYTVAYVDGTTGSVMWASHGKTGGWSTKVAATTKGGADFLSMAYDDSYQPMISYYDAFAADLKTTAFFNNQFNVKTLATRGAQGLYGAAYFGYANSDGSVFAYDRSQNAVTLFTDAEKPTPTATSVVAGGGKYLSVDYDGRSIDFAYFDSAANALVVRPGLLLSDNLSL